MLRDKGSIRFALLWRIRKHSKRLIINVSKNEAQRENAVEEATEWFSIFVQQPLQRIYQAHNQNGRACKVSGRIDDKEIKSNQDNAWQKILE